MIKNISTRLILVIILLQLVAINVQASTTSNRYVLESISHSGTHNEEIVHHGWSVWQDKNKIEIQQDGAPYAVVWEELPGGAIARSEVHHAFKTVVHYTPGDAKALGFTQQWHWSAGLFDGTLVKLLHPVGTDRYADKKATRYKGKIKNVNYQVVWLEQANIPAYIEISDSSRSETISLVNSKQKPEKIHWEESYDDLDYADLGDNETHPLVKAMHNLEPQYMYPGHGH